MPRTPVILALYGYMCRSRLGCSARDEQRLLLGVLADAVGAVARAQPAGLGAAHRQLERGVVDVRVVDAHGARLDAARDRLAARDVLGEDRAAQAVGRVVGQADGLLGVGHLHDRQRRAEGLLAHALHRVVDVDQHGRLEPVAALAVVPALAADDARARPCRPRRATWRSTMSTCGGKVIEPTSAVPGPVERPVAQRARLLGDLGDELVVDRGLDVDALDADARLAAVEHRVVDGGVGRALDVGVGEDDHRVLAAELERDRRERLGRPGHDLLAGGRRAREHDHVDLVDERRARGAARRWRPRRRRRAGRTRAARRPCSEARQRGHLAGLEDDRVAGRERRDGVAEGVRQRVVPRADDPDQAERAVAQDHPLALEQGRGALDALVGQVGRGVLGPEAEGVGRVHHLGDERVLVGLARLGDDRLDDALGVVDDPLLRAAQDPRRGPRSPAPPRPAARRAPRGRARPPARRSCRARGR